jgi:KDO2-lipid IV(A) lauroyltransferase
MGWILQLFCRCFAVLPRRASQALGRGLGRFLGSILRYRRGEAMAAMRRAFPEKGEPEIRALANAMYRHLGLTIAEIARLSVLGRADLDGRVTVAQDENQQRLAGQAGGAILLLGHIGNWEHVAVISATLARKLHAIVKPLKPASLQRFVERTRAMVDLHLLSFRGDFGEALRVLRRGEVVAVILDQNQRRSMGVFVDFLGETACTSHGLALLSSLSGAPVFPIYDRRNPDGSHAVRVLPPIAPPPDRETATLQAFTQTYTRALEDIIRQQPDQWTWIHRRWRTRPGVDGDEGALSRDSEARRGRRGRPARAG